MATNLLVTIAFPGDTPSNARSADLWQHTLRTKPNSEFSIRGLPLSALDHGLHIIKSWQIS